jgi:hypothetical protein
MYAADSGSSLSSDGRYDNWIAGGTSTVKELSIPSTFARSQWYTMDQDSHISFPSSSWGIGVGGGKTVKLSLQMQNVTNSTTTPTISNFVKYVTITATRRMTAENGSIEIGR